MKTKEKLICVITCHEQEQVVHAGIERMNRQSRKPDYILVVDDHSSIPFKSKVANVKVLEAEERGRSSTRNLGIKTAYDLGADVVICMDGDSIPVGKNFCKNYCKMVRTLERPAIFFGTRFHIMEPENKDYLQWEKENVSAMKLWKYIKKQKTDFKRLPSDFYTGNAYKIVNGLKPDFRDLRDLSGVVKGYEDCETFSEKVDWVLSGMITWSCNFCMGREALKIIYDFMLRKYGIINQVFDENQFRLQWGYEDVALGLDALYAGVDIKLQNACQIAHFMHGSVDNPLLHIRGKHIIMERYRRLQQDYDKTKFDVPDRLTITGELVSLDGTAIERSHKDSVLISQDLRKIVNGVVMINPWGEAKKMSLLKQWAFWLLCKIILGFSTGRRKVKKEKKIGY